MSNIKEKFDKITVGQFRNDFQNAVAELEAKYKVNISLGTLTFDGGEVRGKMIALKGVRNSVKLQKEDLKVGDIVTINHKTVDPKIQFRVVKKNKKTLKVQNLSNKFHNVKVSPGLLVKA